MSTNYKYLIKNLNSGKDLDEVLPAYTSMLANQYHDYALMQIMMQYYVMCEQYTESFFKEQEVMETVEFIHEIMANLFLDNSDCKKDAVLVKVDEERTRVIRKMEVLTNYTDQLMIYEYILNRLEHRYDETWIEEDDTMFANQLLQYILKVKDSFIINERVKDVIGQLPVRMARSKFFERIKNSITLYKGSERESLDGYLYMLRTSAMLYTPEADGQYFKNWDAFVDTCKKTDYENLTETELTSLMNELKRTAADISDASEVFVTLQELINSLYVYLLVDSSEEESIQCLTCKNIITELITHVQNKGGSLSESFMEMLEELEGTPENIMMKIQQLMGSFQMVKEAYGKEIMELQLENQFSHFDMAQDLLSSSIFIEFKEKNLEKVTDKDIEEETTKLISEFTELFKLAPIRVIRAVIASVISRMPVFFANVDEISEYIVSSLEQCKDMAEKQASYELLKGMMDEDE
ncbi:MAG: hypothetical protein IKL07_05560 [Clostridium sp.]|nr:hypothetical protein [Clostridium sp.]